MNCVDNKCRAWFANCLDHVFYKDFDNLEKMEDFILRAAKVGTKLIGFVGI